MSSDVTRNFSIIVLIEQSPYTFFTRGAKIRRKTLCHNIFLKIFFCLRGRRGRGFSFQVFTRSFSFSTILHNDLASCLWFSRILLMVFLVLADGFPVLADSSPDSC